MKHNWEYKRLGDVCIVVGGSTPRTDIPEYWDGEYNWFTPAEINGSKYYAESERKITTEAVKSCGLTLMPIGTVLLTSRAPIGKLGILKSEAFCNQGFKNLICKESLYNEYLYYALQYFKDDIQGRGRGATFKEISKKITESILIPVPPMEVQEQIVAELDKINELIEKNRELLRNLNSLAQSLYIHMFGNWSEFEQLSYYVTQLIGGKSLASQETCANKVLKSGAVTYDYFDGSSTKFLPQNYIPVENHKVKIGDVIISRMNTAELVGACAYVFNVEENIYLPDRLWRLEYKPNANPIFLWKSLISETSKRQIRSKASGTSGSMKNISKPLLLSVRIPKVPLAMQDQFASKVEAIEAQKATVEKSIAELQTLLDSRMDYWFN